MWNPVSYQEIENRLAICCEFLCDRNKPAGEAYDSLMEKLGAKLMEYSEFEYWFKRFQNNLFDFGYDTSLDKKETSENQKKIVPKASQAKKVSAMNIERNKQKKVVERNVRKLKPDHQFNEKNVPLIFQTLINRHSTKMRKIEVCFNEQYCTIKLDEIQKIRIRLNKRRNDWMIRYASHNTVIKISEPEKSIIDHLWFVLRNPNIKLEFFGIYDNRNHESKLNHSQKLDFDKLNTLLQSMFNSINHQIQTTILACTGFTEDTFSSMLKHLKSGSLEVIVFNISWKKEGNYRKLKKIVKTDQWKQAKKINSFGVTPLKIDDLFQCECFCSALESVIPENVLRVTEHVFNSAVKKFCTLSSKNKKLDVDAIMNALRSQNDGSEIIEIGPFDQYRFCYVIVKLGEIVFLYGGENEITIQKH